MLTIPHDPERVARIIARMREDWEYLYDLLGDIAGRWAAERQPFPSALDELCSWLAAQQPPVPRAPRRHRRSQEPPPHPYDLGYAIGFAGGPPACPLDGEPGDYWRAGHAAGLSDRAREATT